MIVKVINEEALEAALKEKPKREKYIPQEPTTMRLKGFWCDRKGNGQRFIYKLKDYYWQLYYAWGRALDGYDDVDLFAMHHRLCERLIAQLTDFHKYHSDIVVDPETDELVLRIIDLLGYGRDDERSYRELFPDVPERFIDLGDDSFTLPEYTTEQYLAAEQYTDDRLVEAFTLIGKNIRELWY